MKWLLPAGVAFLLAQGAPVGNGAVIDSMDAVSFSAPKEKGRVQLVPGREGKALQFSFDKDCSGVFMNGRASGKSEWDRAAGISFWVKGDGSEHLGGIEFIWNGDYATRYAYAFPIDNTDWKKVVVPWGDLIPELGKTTAGVNPSGSNPPSKLGPFQFGKWWYWRDYAAHTYTIDDMRLEPTIAVDRRDYRPTGEPLARTLAKLKAGRPITIVTMGDSLTDVNHWTNREHNWPTLLAARIMQKYRSEVTIVNPAMGGTELRHNVVLLPRWQRQAPKPDLVTIFFGFNDWNSGMRGQTFAAAHEDAIDRIRRTTLGNADVLILTSCPTLENGGLLAEMAAACRNASNHENAGAADVYKAFQAVPEADKPALFASDKVHLSLKGQDTVADTVLNAIERAGR
jgi:lysophospholipase L1-like esterase